MLTFLSLSASFHKTKDNNNSNNEKKNCHYL